VPTSHEPIAHGNSTPQTHRLPRRGRLRNEDQDITSGRLDVFRTARRTPYCEIEGRGHVVDHNDLDVEMPAAPTPAW
jgi:hypothetical protein